MRVARTVAGVWLAFVAAAFLGCRAPSDDGPAVIPSTPPPAVELSIEATDPAQNQEGFPREDVVRIDFNQAVAPSSVAPYTITFSSPYGPIAGTFTVLSDLVEFEADGGLPPSVTITGTVTTDVKAQVGGRTLAADHTWTFTSGPGPQALLSGENLRQARVAVSTSGMVLAVALEEDPDRFRSCRYMPGTGWDLAIEEIPVAAFPVSNFRMFGTDAGAVLFWAEGVGTNGTVRFARHENGWWGAPETLATGVNLNFYLGMTAHREGWGGLVYRVGVNGFFRYLDADGVWQAAEPILASWGEIPLEAGPDGTLFTSIVGDPNPINMQTPFSGGFFTPAVGWSFTTLVDYASFSGSRIGVDAAGEAVLMTGTSGAIRSWRYSGSEWTLLGNYNGSGLQVGLLSPSLAMNPDGRACLSWRQGPGSSMNVYACVLDPASGWLGMAPLDVGDSYQPSLPTSLSRDDGRITALYSQADGTSSSIWRVDFDPLDGWSEREDFDEGSQNCLDPSAAAFGDVAAAAWLQQVGVEYELVATLID